MKYEEPSVNRQGRPYTAKPKVAPPVTVNAHPDAEHKETTQPEVVVETPAVTAEANAPEPPIQEVQATDHVQKTDEQAITHVQKADVEQVNDNIQSPDEGQPAGQITPPPSPQSNEDRYKAAASEFYKKEMERRLKIQDLTCQLQELKYPNDKYDMGILDSVQRSIFKKYVDFSSRASRSEFWQYVLVYYMGFAAVLALTGLLNLLVGNPFASIFIIYMFLFLWAYGLFLPTFAIQVRRLHDIGKSGWHLLVSFIPFVGPFVLLYWYIQPGQDEPNEYGNKGGYIEITPDMSKELRLSTTPGEGFRWAMVALVIGLYIVGIAAWIYLFTSKRSFFL